jgi:translation elongation factor EF-Tu-like GTPase
MFTQVSGRSTGGRGVLFPSSVTNMFGLTVEDVFVINGGPVTRVDGIEMVRKQIYEATGGDNVGLVFASLDRSQLGRGAVLTLVGPPPPTGGRTANM